MVSTLQNRPGVHPTPGGFLELGRNPKSPVIYPAWSTLTVCELENPPIKTMGKSTISMAICNSYVKLPEGNLV